MKIQFKLIIVFILLLALLCVSFVILKPKRPESRRKSLQFDTLILAKTQQEREQGLMNQQSICKKCGMLFIFETQKPLSFWMKNTNIPLDMIFIDINGQIVQIHQNTIPYQTNPVYSSVSPAKYVLETNAFFTLENDIQINDILDIDMLIKNGEPYKNLDKLSSVE